MNEGKGRKDAENDGIMHTVLKDGIVSFIQWKEKA